MKTWKKLSLVLCLTMAFSSLATACGSNVDNSSTSASSSSSSTSDNSSSSVVENNSSSSSGNEEDDDKYMVDLYLGIIANTLEESQSAKMTFAFETTTTASVTDGVGELGGWTNYKLTGEALVTKTEEGFDAKLSVQLPSEENKGETETRGYYYIDGYTYLYNEETKKYEKYNETIGELLDNEVHAATQGQYTLEELFAGMIGGGGIVGGDLDMSDMSYEKLEESLGKYAVMESKITDTGLIVTADASKETDKLFDFVRTLDKDTTIGELLNFPLSYIDEDLTTEVIIDELFMHRNDTVAELVSSLETKSKEETNKTLQENIDTILKNKIVEELLNYIENEELVNKIKTFKISEFLEKDSSILNGETPIKNKDLTMDNLANELVSSLLELLGEEGDDILGEINPDLLEGNVKFSMLIAALETVLDWKAGIPEEGELYELLTKVQQIYADKADLGIELKVNTKSVESFSINGVFGGKAASEGKEATIGATLSVDLTEFSKTALTIALPEDAEVVTTYHECAGCKEEKEDVSYRKDQYGYYCGDCYAALPSIVTEPEVTE